ncbi:BTAD domain-containing putative transcriptional regulator [Streptomyces sp. AM 2-1-1]|uniref:AfsR/SARP family transcriptional regulator n=1 Tax=Streptomyces sp. AM 2-1-1 TaxID=3028709 RepID=UPI0023B888CC|nr:BTAD domain-containing putative transcriptional regulator [Streptomyces sp. AM 2-1-1]WEH41195.1 BTAD domain-containing putative transcriptional regulator [Streptomyces sp. AM 2-1-1]
MEQQHFTAHGPHLGLLGHFHLFARTDHVFLPPTAQRLMALLALHQDGVARTRAAGLLWPDLTDRHAAASLRSTLWRLSRRSGQRLVETGAGDSLLHLHGAVRVDLHGAAAQAHRLATRPPAEPPDTVPAELREDLLPGWSDERLVLAREHFHQTRLHALESLSRHLVRAGANTAAMECAMTALRAEPLRESAHRAVTETHLAEGNVAEALRHYDLYRHRLRTELGLAPSSSYRALLAPFLARPLDG